MTGFRFLSEALQEYEDAIEYYERSQPGLGETFMHDVERALAVTLEFPEIGPLVEGMPPGTSLRRRVISRFDVEIDYAIRSDEILVVAIFHCKRHPGYWRSRLGRMR